MTDMVAPEFIPGLNDSAGSRSAVGTGQIKWLLIFQIDKIISK